MSYTPIAAQLRAKYANRSAQTAPAPVVPAAPVLIQADADADAEQQHRAARSEGGLPESWAGALYGIEHGPRPLGISSREWRDALDSVQRRAAEHGAAFAAHGWTFAEVFGVGEHWMRLDERGAAWLALHARIVAVDESRIVFERGAHRTVHRKGSRVQ
jgi:hypothetical protein